MPHPPLVRTRRRPDRDHDHDRAAPDSPADLADRCPGVRRPWPADDGLLVRVRLPGGRVPASALAALSRVARDHGDGDLHLTGRANLQLRALPASPADPGALAPAVATAVAATGLVPSPTHELVRNLMCSPRTGLVGAGGTDSAGGTGSTAGAGRADLRPVVTALDAALCAEPAAAALSGRFLLVLDDGCGDLVERPCDLGAVALDDRSAQLRVGPAWGEVVALEDVPEALVDLVRRFLDARAALSADPDAVWHVAELDGPVAAGRPADDRVPAAAPPLAYGPVPGGEHVPAPDGVLPPGLVDDLVARDPAGTLVVTPWRGLLLPDPHHREEAAR